MSIPKLGFYDTRSNRGRVRERDRVITAIDFEAGTLEYACRSSFGPRIEALPGYSDLYTVRLQSFFLWEESEGWEWVDDLPTGTTSHS